MEIRENLVVVTGGATGIGLAVARHFVEQGEDVVITGRRAPALTRAAKQIGAQAFPCDNADPDHVARLAEHCSAGVRVLVNNAGGIAAPVPPAGDLHGLAQSWLSNYTANMLTAVLTTTALDPLLADGGRVITIGSIAAETGSGSYGPAKAAAQSWTVDLARRLGPRRITANAIAPGYIAGTGFFGPDGPSETRREALLAATMTGRVGQPEDVAGLVAYLASPQAGHVTGQTLHVNAGAVTTR